MPHCARRGRLRTRHPVRTIGRTLHHRPEGTLSYRFVVCCDDAALGTYISGLLGSLRPGDEVVDSAEVARYDVSASSSSSSSRPGSVDVHRDGEVVVLDVPPGDAVATLVWDVNRLAAQRSGEYLLFHSGGLEAAEDVGLLVPAASGSGKSTLTAGLARAGLGYLSDELVALELDGAVPGRLLPYPKPITVKPGSFTALASMDPGPFGAGWSGESAEFEWQVPVGSGTGLRVGSPCRPAYVIVPRYDAGAETALTRMSETEAFFSLALHAVNMLPHGARRDVGAGPPRRGLRVLHARDVGPRCCVRAGARIGRGSGIDLVPGVRCPVSGVRCPVSGLRRKRRGTT